MSKYSLAAFLMLVMSIHTTGTAFSQKSSFIPKGIPSAKVAPKSEPTVIKWYSWQEAMELEKKEKKKVFVDIFIPNCSWCKRLDSETFKDPFVIKYINDNFYPVKLDAKQNMDLQYKNHKYEYIRTPNGGYHELAVEFMQEDITFPSMVFLDENLNLIQTIGKFLDNEELLPIATYFGSDAHKDTPWSAYQRDFKYPEGFK